MAFSMIHRPGAARLEIPSESARGNAGSSRLGVGARFLALLVWAIPTPLMADSMVPT